MKWRQRKASQTGFLRKFPHPKAARHELRHGPTRAGPLNIFAPHGRLGKLPLEEWGCQRKGGGNVRTSAVAGGKKPAKGAPVSPPAPSRAGVRPWSSRSEACSWLRRLDLCGRMPPSIWFRAIRRSRRTKGRRVVVSPAPLPAPTADGTTYPPELTISDLHRCKPDRLKGLQVAS